YSTLLVLHLLPSNLSMIFISSRLPPVFPAHSFGESVAKVHPFPLSFQIFYQLFYAIQHTFFSIH
ncbi:MAG TPA: hypothetical protein H9859_07230, partial [Candidatus Barnesiella excrementigallinarum]|nr:hypothetical protein [Candidatus Barnesiella excrementigallinarum]